MIKLTVVTAFVGFMVHIVNCTPIDASHAVDISQSKELLGYVNTTMTTRRIDWVKATFPTVNTQNSCCNDYLRGHDNDVESVSFSPDGKRVASGSKDWSIQIWDFDNWDSEPLTLREHTDSVNSIDYSPDGVKLASGSNDKTIIVWNLEINAADYKLEGHTDKVFSVQFSPDGTRIASGSADGTIKIWDLENGGSLIQTLEGHSKAVNSVDYSPDGTKIVSGSSDYTIVVWDLVNKGSIIKRFYPKDYCACAYTSVDFSPDGTKIASGSSDKIIRIWDLEKDGAYGRAIIQVLEGHTDRVSSVDYSPDGTRIASGSMDQTIKIWNVEDGGNLIVTLKGHTDTVQSLQFNPDGTRIVSGSYDGTIRMLKYVQDPASPSLTSILSSPSTSTSAFPPTPSSTDQSLTASERPSLAIQPFIFPSTSLSDPSKVPSKLSTTEPPSVPPSKSTSLLNPTIITSKVPSQLNTTNPPSVPSSESTSPLHPAIIALIASFFQVAVCFGIFHCYKKCNGDYSTDKPRHTIDQEYVTTSSGNTIRVPDELLAYNKAKAKIDNWRNNHEGIV